MVTELEFFPWIPAEPILFALILVEETAAIRTYSIMVLATYDTLPATVLVY